MEKIYQAQAEKLALIEEQIEKCTIRAPRAGQVVYANVQSRGRKEIIIEEGAVVREHQTILRLPDATTMQVKATIDEAAVALVEEDMPVRIQLDAFKETELSGSVRKVNEYPEPPSSSASSVKEYKTTIGIDEPAKDETGGSLPLRPGMTAKVQICVQRLPDVIQVPVRAVFEHGGKHYCVESNGENLRPRPVTIGSTNDETVVIVEGLEAGEQVVMGAASYRDELDLPLLHTEVQPETPGGPLMHRVARGEFVQEITERGNVESANNVEIKCEVQSLGAGTMILWVIPEGTHVEPAPDWEPDPDDPDEDPPDLLVKLDTSFQEEREVVWQSLCRMGKAMMVQAENNLEIAELELKEYLEGKFEQQKQIIENRIFAAQEYLRRAEENLKYDQAMLMKGYLTPLMVQADRFAVAKARKDWEAARLELAVLKDFSSRKTEKSMQAEIGTAAAWFDSQKREYQLDLKRLAYIQEQIEKCMIRAPEAGQVVYANKQSRSGEVIVIEEGTVVREHQVLIQLPDRTNMQIKAKINEATVATVQDGMPVRAQLDAFEGVELTGSVKKVNEYPGASSSGTAVKEYETTIGIDELPKDEGRRAAGPPTRHDRRSEDPRADSSRRDPGTPPGNHRARWKVLLHRTRRQELQTSQGDHRLGQR